MWSKVNTAGGKEKHTVKPSWAADMSDKKYEKELEKAGRKGRKERQASQEQDDDD